MPQKLHYFLSHYAENYVAPWLFNATTTLWEPLFCKGVSRTYPAGKTIRLVGQNAREIFFIRKGLACIMAYDAEGGQKNIGILGCGAVLGDASFFRRTKRTTHVVQAIDDCEGVLFNEKTIHEHILTNKNLCQYLLEGLAAKCYIMSSQLELYFSTTCTERVMHFLYHLSLAQKNSEMSWQKLSSCTLTSLSILLGMHRVTLSKIINELRTKGFLSTKKGKNPLSDISLIADVLLESSDAL